jgi:hypothetical protein
MLADHVRDPDLPFNLHELDLAEFKSLRLVEPAPIRLFGPGPAGRDRHDEAFAPAAMVVADVGNDLVTTADGPRGVAGEIVDVHW